MPGKKRESVTRIEVDGGMLKAWRQGLSSYQPVFREEPMEVEAGSVEVSLRNLRKIIKAIQAAHSVAIHPVVRSLEVGPNRNVLVTFVDGETYLATGFSIGHAGIEVAGLAEFAAEIGQGEKDALFELWSTLPEDYTGELPKPPGELRVTGADR